MQAQKVNIKPGQIGLVMGCGPIGLVTAVAALAGGCSKVYIADIVSEKLETCVHYPILSRLISLQKNYQKEL